MFEKQKELLREELKDACSIILVSFNLWTLLNLYIILRVMGHFINKDSRHCQVVLGLYEVVNKYNNKNIAGVLIDLF